MTLAPTDHLKFVAGLLNVIEPYLMSVQTLPVLTAKVEQYVHGYFHPTPSDDAKPAEPQ